EVEVCRIQPAVVEQEVPLTEVREMPVEVPTVQEVDLVRQVSCPRVAYRNKFVPRVETVASQRIVPRARLLTRERPSEVPQVQQAEAVRQEPRFEVREVSRAVPRFSVQYRERVEEVRPLVLQERARSPPPRVPPVQVRHHRPSASTSSGSTALTTAAPASLGLGLVSPLSRTATPLSRASSSTGTFFRFSPSVRTVSPTASSPEVSRRASSAAVARQAPEALSPPLAAPRGALASSPAAAARSPHAALAGQARPSRLLSRPAPAA
ncbi:unnamed protein product, partial [Prorocentrum cordatum]